MIDLATTSKAFFRIDELLLFLPVSKRTVQYWIAQGRIHAIPGLTQNQGARIPIDEVRRIVRVVNGDLVPRVSAAQERANVA